MLQLQNVKKSYPQPGSDPIRVLDVADYRVGRGEQAVLIGRSGGGKTTLLHIISGITRPDSGLVKIDGTDIGTLPEHRRDRFRAENIGYVFQTFNLLPAFTALENVMLGMAFVRGHSDQARARHLLDRVGLSHRLTHRPGMLSVGEQQRVSVARALANRPKLLLADEPTANVDQGHQQQIVDLIREVCEEEQVAMVLVTHVPEVAEQFERVDRLEDINLAMQTPVKSP